MGHTTASGGSVRQGRLIRDTAQIAKDTVDHARLALFDAFRDSRLADDDDDSLHPEDRGVDQARQFIFCQRPLMV